MKFCRISLFAFVCCILCNRSFAQLTYRTLDVKYDSAWTFKNLEIIPIKFKGFGQGFASSGNRPITFSQALKKRKVKLKEIAYEEGADVNWLQVTNRSKQDLMMQSGEIVAGGKQDRMIAETKILPPGTTDYIHVYCVEKRRWDRKSKQFTSSGFAANSELRKVMDINARQNAVWKEIDRQYASAKKSNETVSYLHLYNDSVWIDTSYYNYFTNLYSKTDSSFAGYIFITGNRILSCELFTSAELTDVSFNNMLTSYIQSVITNGAAPAVPLSDVKAFTDKILTSESAQKKYVTAHGKLHYFDGKLIHLIAYPD
jgi:hypothetical protein